jgi:hypothetical protein
MSVDRFLDRRYDPRRYNCLHFAAEVWAELTGEDAKERLDALIRAAIGEERLQGAAAKRFKRLAAPESPSLVLMKRRGSEPHVGVFIRGRILHITTRGVEFFPPAIAAFGYQTVSYYR